MTTPSPFREPDSMRKWMEVNAIFRGLLGIAILSAPVAGHAQGILSGTSTFLGARTCNPGGSGCDTYGPNNYPVYGGNPGDTSSSINQNISGYGLTTASAALTSVIGAPTLTAYSASSVGTRESSAAYGLQSYTYTGSTATTDTFGGTLTYSQTMTGSYPPASGVGTEAEIEVFTLSTASFAAGATPADNYAAMSNPSTQPGFTLLGSDMWNDTATNPSGNKNLSVSLMLAPGETVWVWAWLDTWAPNGSTVDASHTLVTQWSSSADLVPGGPAPVPLPASAWLMLSALGGLAALARKKRAA